MIQIEEKTAVKVPGMTSLFLTFEYNKDAIEVIKSCDGAQWDKKKKWWEVPILNLSYLLDRLVLLDDIQLTLKDEQSRQYQKYVPKEGDVLFEHQIQGVEFGTNNDKWLLLDAPGLGKTLQIIRLAEALK